MTKETGISLVAGLLCGISCLAGFLVGIDTERERFQKECVKRGVGEYDKTSGSWQWSGFTNDNANFNELMERNR
jgi:hypothetical protein